MFVSIWNRTNPCVTAWGPASSLNAPNAPKGSIAMKMLDNTGILCNIMLNTEMLITYSSLSEVVEIEGRRQYDLVVIGGGSGGLACSKEGD